MGLLGVKLLSNCWCNGVTMHLKWGMAWTSVMQKRSCINSSGRNSSFVLCLSLSLFLAGTGMIWRFDFSIPSQPQILKISAKRQSLFTKDFVRNLLRSGSYCAMQLRHWRSFSEELPLAIRTIGVFAFCWISSGLKLIQVLKAPPTRWRLQAIGTVHEESWPDTCVSKLVFLIKTFTFFSQGRQKDATLWKFKSSQQFA